MRKEAVGIYLEDLKKGENISQDSRYPYRKPNPVPP